MKYDVSVLGDVANLCNYLSNPKIDKIITTSDLYENEDYVIIRTVKETNGKQYVTYEKGLKDKNGDIVDFSKCDFENESVFQNVELL